MPDALERPPDQPREAAADAATIPATGSPPVPVASSFAPLAVRRWEIALVAALAALLYLPRLGSYGLWDPWEGHYAEVGRRMLEERDLLRMRWQAETFYSKPPLTPWMMAAGLRLFGVAEDGGYSGELVSSHRGEWGVRLPFALFGIAGVLALWYALARFHSRRAAWLAAGITATTPLYFFVTRQAITDMPSTSLLLIAMALFLVAVFGDGDRPLPRIPRLRGLTQLHVFLAVFALIVLWQLVYFAVNLQGAKLAIAPRRFIPGWLVTVPFFVVFAGVAAWTWLRTRTVQQVTMYWFYLACGVAVLAKGPLTPGLVGMAILTYLVLTGEWRLLRKVELLRGVLIALLVALPWHFAMYAKEGNPWLNEYVGQHLINRAVKGVHGDRGTFQYFLEQVGIGMWPWVALIPAALVPVALAGRGSSTRERIRLLFAIWAIVGFFFFSAIQTKFHHYILPALPAFAALIAFWLDDLLDGRARHVAALVLVTAAMFILLSLDLVPAQEKLVRLFIYRYDRTIPKGPPFRIDYTGTLTLFALAMFVPLVLLAWGRARRIATAALLAVALAFTVFAIDGLIVRVTPHFGQRQLLEAYYQRRQIFGVDLVYEGLREVNEDWSSGQDLLVRSVIPQTLTVGAPMRVGLSAAGEKLEMAGQVARIGEDRFWIAVPPGERARLAPLLERARQAGGRQHRRWVVVDAERLISRLYWRGESFYAGGEIWNPHFPDAQTVFHELNDGENKKWNEYLKAREGKGRRFWVLVEQGRLEGVRSLLPNESARASFRKEDESSSFFGLGSFVL